MPQHTIIAYGKIPTNSPEGLIIQEYNKRLLNKTKIIELKEPCVEKDLTKIISDFRHLILLDIEGRIVDSSYFAHIYNYDNLAFLIGPSEGFSPKIKNLASDKISFGRITLPHKFVRAILYEQLYRGQTMHLNHPYHK